MDLIKLGSETAKNGFKNEDDIIKKINNWRVDKDAQKWLIIMEYCLDEIEYVKAVKISGYKTDIQTQVIIKLKEEIEVQNLQVKLVSNSRGFNQIDKRKVEKYHNIWEIPKKIMLLLRLYTGELEPRLKSVRDKRRMFADEFNISEQNQLLDWIKNNKSLIVSDILKGRGKFAAEWMLVAHKMNKNARWILKSMNYCLNFFSQGDVKITNRGNIRIGKITMQRKGGDGGRETAKMLQFKINPAELFNIRKIL